MAPNTRQRTDSPSVSRKPPTQLEELDTTPTSREKQRARAKSPSMNVETAAEPQNSMHINFDFSDDIEIDDYSDSSLIRASDAAYNKPKPAKSRDMWSDVESCARPSSPMDDVETVASK